MVRCGFLFDLIVVRVEVPNAAIEDNKLLSVDCSFNNITLNITPSRINVVEFKPRRSFEFDTSPEDLRRDLSICPLKLKVYYESRSIGEAIVPWSECVLDRINKDMGEITHIDECDLVDSNEERVGHLEYICRITCKCEEPSDELCTNIGGYDLKKHINKIIDPNDILFVVAEPNKEDVCNVPLTEELGATCATASPTTALDLSPFRILNGRLVQTGDALNTCPNDDCCTLMKTSDQYQKLIEALNPCKKSKDHRKCQASAHCDQCPHKDKLSVHSDSSSECSFDDCKECQCFAPQHDKPKTFGGRKLPIVKVCGPQMPDNSVHDFNGPRHCPVCNENLKWLPKLGTCPKCGYKPVPLYVEKPHNECETADQILQQYYMERTEGGTDKDSASRKNCGKPSDCRCTCKKQKGKTCANCRVRQMCGNILQKAPAQNNDCGGCEEDDEERFRVCSSEKDCRPHLARVFSELKDLFDAPTPRTDQLAHHEACERELNPPPQPQPSKRPSQQQHQQRRSTAPSATKVSMPCPCPCPCEEPKRKRKRLCKRRGQPRCATMRTKDFCKPPSCDQGLPAQEDRLQKFHDDCVSHRRNVPRNMGWLWNAHPEFGPHWRPGTIRKPIKEIMSYFLRDFPADTIPISKYYRRNTSGKGDCPDENEESLVQQPTLHICKKNGEIYVTLRPLKNPEALKNCANPYLNMKPIQFKIVKNPLASEISKMKRCLKDMGFNKCTCHQPLVECFCRTFLDKKRLEYQIKKECRKRGLEDSFCENLILSDTSDSEVEYDFGVTPPAGLIKPERARKPDKVNVGTQYEMCDWNIPPVNPLPPNQYMKWINCATGSKYAYRRADDLLTIGQLEARACRKKKAEEDAINKKLNKQQREKLAAARAALEEAMPKEIVETKFQCANGKTVDMAKYMTPEAGPAGKKKKK